MTTDPEMISGPGEFDCRLMQVGAGKIVCKRGAEGYQAIGYYPALSAPVHPASASPLKSWTVISASAGPTWAPTPASARR
jgi:hypothetical protein